jgi:maleate isomerase
MSTQAARRPGPALYRETIERDERPPETAVGVVVPFDFELDWEYWRYLPEGVSLYFTRTPFLNQPVGMRLARDVGNPKVVARATRALNSLNPAVTLYACSSGSFVRGLAGEEALRAAMVAAGARAAVTTSGAMIDAFKAAGARKIALATPYTQRLTASLADFVEEAGFEAVSVHCLGLSSGIGTVSRTTIANLVRQTGWPEADAVFVSCTALRTHGIVAMLEQELHCPVFTSNQVSLWAALDAAGALIPDDGETPVLGDGHPMARSTSLLLEASRTGRLQRAG